MALHDAELIQRTLEGDESAFGFLVDKYKGSVHALAYRKLGNFHTAEEITQDTFLKAYQKLSTLKDPGRFPGWLYVIAARCCISWFRQNRVQTESLDSVKGEMDTQSWTKYTDARLREEVHNALESLPESERTVLTLYYMAGMTSEEIGRFIGTSCGAIRDRLYRARIHLKEELTMIEQTLGGFQLPPTLTQEIMRRIPNGSLNPTPTTSKPLAPWIVATSLVVVTLLIGLGVRQTTTFQLPYSFDAPESATMVEIVDAPIINMPLLTFSPVSRTGGLSGGESGNGNRENDSDAGKLRCRFAERYSIEIIVAGRRPTDPTAEQLQPFTRHRKERTLRWNRDRHFPFSGQRQNMDSCQRRVAGFSRQYSSQHPCANTGGKYSLRRYKRRPFLFNQRAATRGNS